MSIAPSKGDLHKIVILNPKGGCGKTTLATNIAAFFAMRGQIPTLIDRDPQGFSTRWLDKRPENLPKIQRWQAQEMPLAQVLQRPPGIRSSKVIVDLPAAVSTERLQEVTYDAGSILIPVLPSEIDVTCAARFIAELLLNAQIDRRNRQLAIVANRTRQNNKSYRLLMRFLTSLRIPLIAVLRDSQNYVHAAGRGIGICEMPAYQTEKDLPDWQLIINWLDQWRMRQLDSATSSQFEHVPGTQVLTPMHHLEHH